MGLAASLFFSPSNDMRLLSSKAQGSKDVWKPEPSCVGIHRKAVSEYSYVSAVCVPGF